ncbi:hypothetical protein GCM10011514_40860 [Emticicia aquatilis]|uniref:Uncharacterized protein n=1 Tax=Emticicia aquatilis TaxID=1537369 RepID=A0A917DVH2_9BACT|nr:hypothetical protein [Emticicia aquatilis]GGD72588.1 hypothetical protein GCM10011514_40860 [Emticicia aquatilis]
MNEKIKAYRDFIDWLTNTDDAFFYSKTDLENYEHKIISSNNQKESKLDETLAILGPIFKSLSEEQKNALGDWSEHMYFQGIVNCLEQIQFNDEIQLAFINPESKIEIFENISFAEDFRKRHKVVGATEWDT